MPLEKEILSTGLQDYIETIYISHIKKQPLKGAQLARIMNVSRASVSEALSKLVEKRLIKYNSYEAISITLKGIKEAKKIYNKHSVLKSFFEKVLSVDEIEASDNACKIEHIISENILEKMSKLTILADNNPKFLEIINGDVIQNG